jgi:hypothetical protein
MRKPTQLQFATINLAVFALALPAYIAWAGSASPLAVRVVLIILAGVSGWLGFVFLVAGLISRIAHRKATRK